MRAGLRSFCVVALTAAPVVAQCPAWSPDFSGPTLNGPVLASAVFDDGTGPALFVAGDFTYSDEIVMTRIARWDGHYSQLAGGANAAVLALCTFDDGTGTALYAGGAFTITGGTGANRVARWNGTSWSPLAGGADGIVRALAVHDDGNGPALYAGGDFTHADGNPASHVARWNGTAWQPLPVGTSNGTSGTVDSFAVFDDGSGAQLYAGGLFLSAGAVPARNVARWNGATWSILGNGTNGRVRALAVFDAGTGPALCAGGDFTTAGGLAASRVARWNGTAWSALDTGLDQTVRALFAFDDGSGQALYAGGGFTHAGSNGLQAVARWNGTAWSAVGEGLAGQVETLCAEPTSGVARLVAAGSCTLAENGGILNVARWDGTRWNALAQGITPNYVSVIRVADEGTGPTVYVGGLFDQVGGTAADGIGKWVDDHWEHVGPSPATSWPFAFATLDEGAGPRLIVAGGFSTYGGVSANSVVRFDGTTWSPLGAGLNGNVYSLAVHDGGGGPVLYAGGTFTMTGGASARYIARWDGTAWSEVGGGLTPPVGQSYANVRSMVTYDDGSGPALYIAGDFRRAGTVDALRVARWDGTSWSALGTGLTSPAPYLGFANALAVFDDGSGRSLFAGGLFLEAGGVSVNRLAKWDGSAWSAVGAGATSGVYSLATFDDGTGNGTALFAGLESSILRWDGSLISTYAPASTVAYDYVQSLAVMPAHDGAPAELWAGGTFNSIGGVASLSVARLVACDAVGAIFCSGDGTGTACPCGNAGASGNGCASSFNAAGGHFTARGNASVSDDSVVLDASGISNAIATFFQGTQRVNGGAGAVFGDGLRCAGGTTVRIAAVQAGAGEAHYPGAGDASVSVRGMLPGTGGKRTYQVWYRNAAAFCTPSTFTFTNGLELDWLP